MSACTLPRPILDCLPHSLPSFFVCCCQGAGLGWLFPLQDGAPPIGWHDAACYLVLPVLLVVSQYVSQKAVATASSDPAQQQTQAFLKFIPFMIGWFSLNVPSGLTLYWLVNNIISTAQQVYMKKTIQASMAGKECLQRRNACIIFMVVEVGGGDSGWLGTSSCCVTC